MGYSLEPDRFRRLGHRMVDWIADYHTRIESFPVFSRSEPGTLLAALPLQAPEQGLDEAGWEEIFADLDRLILPGLTHWQAPGFFGYFPANASAPAILGELLSAGLGVQGMLWSTSPAATELEIRMLDWLAGMLGLPERFRSSGPGGGCIQGTASESTLVAMVAARERAGGSPASLTLYASTQAHSSVAKAARIAGLPPGALHLVAVDENCRMDAGALARAMRADRTEGLRPFFVCATAGTTSSGAVDPIPAVAAAARAQGAWLHVDAAWAGSACICPEYRGILEGVSGAMSLTFNPHKWLLVNFDCNCLWVADRKALTQALGISPAYLRDRAGARGEVIDYRDWQIPLGRRFRALKLWFAIRHYGVEGLRAHIRRQIGLAELFEDLLRGDPRFEPAAPRSLALVCFRLRGPDRANEKLLAMLNAGGKAFLTHTLLPGPGGKERYTLRMAIGSPKTEEHHVRAAWERIQRLADGIGGYG